MHEWSKEEADWYKALRGRFPKILPLSRTGKIGALIALAVIIVQVAIVVSILVTP